MLVISVMSLAGCAYNPVIDTGGRSGTFNQSKADKITDDVMLCKQLAKKHLVHKDDVEWVECHLFHSE